MARLYVLCRWLTLGHWRCACANARVSAHVCADAVNGAQFAAC